jgi:hypothetical protein
MLIEQVGKWILGAGEDVASFSLNGRQQGMKFAKGILQLSA